MALLLFLVIWELSQRQKDNWEPQSLNKVADPKNQMVYYYFSPELARRCLMDNRDPRFYVNGEEFHLQSFKPIQKGHAIFGEIDDLILVKMCPWDECERSLIIYQ